MGVPPMVKHGGENPACPAEATAKAGRSDEREARNFASLFLLTATPKGVPSGQATKTRSEHGLTPSLLDEERGRCTAHLD